MDLPFPDGFADPQQKLLRGVPAFAALSEAALKTLAAHLTEQQFPKHAVVLDEGEPADRLFLIEDGEVEVSMKTAEGRVPLTRLSDGEMFGEVALLQSSKRRTARVTALTPLLTSTLRSRHLTEVLDEHPEVREVLAEAADQALVRSFIKSTQPFERLTPERLNAFVARLRAHELEPGATVFEQGDQGDACYLVRSGLVDVIRTEPAGARTVARLGAGEIVGESALLSATPRDASLRVVEGARLLALHRTDFIEVLGQDSRVAEHMVELMRQRDRPIWAPGVVLQPRPTATGETLWVLADPSRLGAYHQVSSLGLFVWNRMDGNHTVAEVASKYRADRGEVAVEEIARIMAELVAARFATARRLEDEVALAAAPRKPWWRKLWRGSKRDG